MQNTGKIVQIIGAVVDIHFSKDCLQNLHLFYEPLIWDYLQ